jgi:tetratricopeptide (TPR) repeat protein
MDSSKSSDLIQPEGIDAEVLRQHLSKIEDSETFMDVEHQRKLLSFLVKKRLTGREDHIKAVEIVEEKMMNESARRKRPGEELLFPDDQAVRTHIGRLRKTLLVYYHQEAPSASIQIDIPKRKYIATFSRVSQPAPPPKVDPAIQKLPGAPVSVSDYQSAENLNKSAVRLYKHGQYSEAEPILERVLAIREKALGSDHPDTATSLNNLAMLYEKQGRYQEAIPLLERSLTICERVLGADHPDTIISLNNVAIGYVSQGRYKEAVPLLERALAVREQSLGENHPEIATSLNNLAMLYEKQGRYQEAVPLLERSLAVREQSLGPDHPDTANSLNNLAMIFKKQARFKEAVALCQRALDICERVLVPDHPQTATVRSNYVDLSEV